MLRAEKRTSELDEELRNLQSERKEVQRAYDRVHQELGTAIQG